MQEDRGVNVDSILQDIQQRNEDDEDVRAVTDTLEKDQTELLATLMAKRAAIENDPTLDPSEKERLLKVWDDKINMLQQMLKDEALSLITYLQAESKPEPAAETALTGNIDGGADAELAPSVRELELNAELLLVKSQLECMREELTNISAVPAPGGETGDADNGDGEHDDDPEAMLNAKENEMLAFERANAKKLQVRAFDTFKQSLFNVKLLYSILCVSYNHVFNLICLIPISFIDSLTPCTGARRHPAQAP